MLAWQHDLPAEGRAEAARSRDARLGLRHRRRRAGAAGRHRRRRRAGERRRRPATPRLPSRRSSSRSRTLDGDVLELRRRAQVVAAHRQALRAATRRKGELLPHAQPDTGAFARQLRELDVRAAGRRPSGRARKLSRDARSQYTLVDAIHLSVEKTFDGRSRRRTSCKLTDQGRRAKVPAGQRRQQTSRSRSYGVPGSEGRRRRRPERRAARLGVVDAARRRASTSTAVKAVIKAAALRVQHHVDRLRASVPARRRTRRSRRRSLTRREAHVRAMGTDGLMRTDILFRPATVQGRRRAGDARGRRVPRPEELHAARGARTTVAGFSTGLQGDDRPRLVRVHRPAAAVAAAQVLRVRRELGHRDHAADVPRQGADDSVHDEVDAVDEGDGRRSRRR